MTKTHQVILFVLLLMIPIISMPITLNHDATAYPEWNEATLNIVDIKPWYNMHLENDHVNMNLILTSHTNKTQSFTLIERIGSLSNPEIVKSLPNSTLYEYVTLKGNDKKILNFSQQFPTGSWYLSVQVMEYGSNGLEVDEKTQFFVIQPFQDLIILIGTIVSGIIGSATVFALLATKKSADNQARELRKQTNLNEIKFKLLNRPWIGSSQPLKLNPSNLILSYTNYGQLPTTSTKAQFLISDTEIHRMHFNTSAVIQTLELGTIMPTKQDDLVIEITDEQRERAYSGKEFFVGIRISYSYSGGMSGEYAAIYYYNDASGLFVLDKEWTDLNKLHSVPTTHEVEEHEHAGLMRSEQETSNPLNRIKTGEIVILDDNEDRVFNPQVNQRVRLGLTIKNNQSTSQTFVYLVQIKNSEGITTRLNSITGVISPWQSLQPLTPWTPTVEGNFIIQFFVWESIDEPHALSPPLTIQLGVLPEKIRRWPRFFRISDIFQTKKYSEKL